MNLQSLHKVLLASLSMAFMLVPGRITEQHVIPKITVAAASTAEIPAQTLDIHRTTHLHVMPVVEEKVAVQKPPTISIGAKGQSALWLNEALAALDYLPLTFTIPKPTAGEAGSQAGSTSQTKPPVNTAPAPGTTNNSTTNATAGLGANATTTAAKHSTSAPAPAPSLATTLALQLQTGAFKPVTGQWKWNGSYPSSLERLWNPNSATVITQGAIMRFQADHGLAVDGVAGPNVYRALEQALSKKSLAAHPYTYVAVSKASPEHLDVWENGRKVYTSLANTGISASPTPNGTWPVYSRLVSQTMRGKNPDGSTYDDPGVPDVNYFYQGCAIHGFPRSSYGSPQSLGCVELPFAAAKTVYSLIGYGTLVTVA